jgi:hypothetical protein
MRSRERGYTFDTSFSLQEMFARLKHVGPWDEWWSVVAGDTLISVAASNPWERHHEKATILWDAAIAKWVLEVEYESEVRDLEERWSRFVSFVCEALFIVDAANIVKLGSAPALRVAPTGT